LPRLVQRPVVVRGFQKLVVRLARTYKHRDRNERHAWAAVLLALADFLGNNGLNGLVLIWLMESASKLTDPGGKGLPSNTWRRYAWVSLGMRALTIDGTSREEAARRAVQSVKDIGDTRTVLQRYDELLKKDGVKNQEARYLFRNCTQLLPEMIERKGAAAVAKQFFDIANVQA
jgi:hypothetical protein